MGKRFEVVKMSCFSPYVHLLISAMMDDFYLSNYYCVLATWGFPIPVTPPAFIHYDFVDGNVIHLTIYLWIQWFKKMFETNIKYLFIVRARGSPQMDTQQLGLYKTQPWSQGLHPGSNICDRESTSWASICCLFRWAFAVSWIGIGGRGGNSPQPL